MLLIYKLSKAKVTFTQHWFTLTRLVLSMCINSKVMAINIPNYSYHVRAVELQSFGSILHHIIPLSYNNTLRVEAQTHTQTDKAVLKNQV